MNICGTRITKLLKHDIVFNDINIYHNFCSFINMRAILHDIITTTFRFDVYEILDDFVIVSIPALYCAVCKKSYIKTQSYNLFFNFNEPKMHLCQECTLKILK